MSYLLLLLLLPLALAEVNITNLPLISFTLLLGPAADCPTAIRFLPTPCPNPPCVTYPAANILFDNQPVNVALNFDKNRRFFQRSGYPALLHRDKPLIGDYYTAVLSSDLSWEGFSFTTGSVAVLFRPTREVRWQWTDVVGDEAATDINKLAPLVREARTKDWVYTNGEGEGAYLIWNHRCMLKETSRQACFPGDSIVSGKRMRDLKIGDVVWTGNEYSPIIAFTHRSEEYAIYKVITLVGQAQVAVSRGHYVYANGRCIRAEEVVVGDWMVTEGGSRRVLKVEEDVRKGIYNPQTANGELMVDQVWVSAYTDALDQMSAGTWNGEWRIGHALLTPVRWIWNVYSLAKASIQ